MSDETNFIAWSPYWPEAYFGSTPDEARRRATTPQSSEDETEDWGKLAENGWRVDPFPAATILMQPQAGDEDLALRVEAVSSVTESTPEIDPRLVLGLLFGNNDDAYSRSISPRKGLDVYMGRVGDKQDGWDVL